jgi:allantoinase
MDNTLYDYSPIVSRPKSLSGEEFYRAVVDQFDQLYKEGHSGRVMALCLHPFIINQSFRHK